MKVYFILCFFFLYVVSVLTTVLFSKLLKKNKEKPAGVIFGYIAIESFIIISFLLIIGIKILN